MEAIFNFIEDQIIIYDHLSRELYRNLSNQEFKNEADLPPLVTEVYLNKQRIRKTIGSRWEVNLFCHPFHNEADAVFVFIRNLTKNMEKPFSATSKLEKMGLHKILDSTCDGLGVISKSGKLLYVNESYLRISGLSREQSGEGCLVSDLVKMGNVSEAVSPLVFQKKTSVTIRQKIRTGKEVLITGSPVFDNEGAIDCVVANIRAMDELTLHMGAISGFPAISQPTEITKVKSKIPQKTGFIANDPAMKNLLRDLKKVAQTEITVLVTGETGTGKELFAKILHELSSKQAGPFITVNCGAIPKDLLESELFGYLKGSFTGANQGGKKGLAEAAHKGTLVLDEIGDMPLNLQVKLLRLIQEKEILPVGATQTTPVDIRIIALTNRNLVEMVKAGTFRQDLYYRLNVVNLEIPPLRHRGNDVLFLTEHLLKKMNLRYASQKTLSADVITAFKEHPWPGNIRELESMLEKLVVMADSEVIKMEDLPNEFFPQLNLQVDEKDNSEIINVKINQLLPMKDAVEQVEKQLLIAALKQKSSCRKVAKELQVNASTVIRKMKKYHIEVN